MTADADPRRGRAPDVIAIIVNYRSAALTARAVASLAEERARHPELRIEAVVVENASGDEAALERAFGGDEPPYADWLTLLISPVNDGFGAGNNRGMRDAMVRGRVPRYFYFLNPDTEVRPHAVSELVRFLDAHPAAGWAGSTYENDDGSFWPTGFRFPSIWSEIEEGCSLRVVTRLLRDHVVRRDMDREGAPEQVDWLPGASMMARREMIEAIGGFDEEFFLYYEETDLALRARRRGWQTWYVPSSVVMHIAGQSTGVTVREGPLRRLPRYWFESRRRFFTKNHGIGYAALADVAFVGAQALGTVKRHLRKEARRPHLLRDFIGDTLRFHLGGRAVPPERSVVAPDHIQSHQPPKPST